MIQINVPVDWYYYYKNKKRVGIKELYMTPNNPVIQELSKKLLEIFNKNNYLSYSEFVVSFVQTIPYESDDIISKDGYPRFPIETLFDKGGDCEDTTYLAASILINFGIDVVLVDFPTHIGLGVACSNCVGKYYVYNSRRYYYLETTGRNYGLGDLPESLKGQTPRIRPLVN
jgi:hypothetical protein